MDICIVGTGYVGLVTGTCLAEVGHRVVSVDDDMEKIATLKQGQIPMFEPGLDNLVTRNRLEGRLSFTADLKKGIETATVIFICVGTPPLEDGDADLSAVEQVEWQALPSLVYYQNPYEAASGADALVVAMGWKEFTGLDLTRVKSLMRRPLMLDGRNLFDRHEMKTMGLEYLGIGR